MPLQRFLSPIAEYVKALLEADAGLAFQRVYYGDQELIDKTPAAAVTPGNVTRALQGVPYQVQADLALYVVVYGGRLGDNQTLNLEIDRLTEATALAIDKDSLSTQFGGTLLGDNVIHGHCVTIDYGYAIRSNKLVRANRIMWLGLTKTGLTPEVSG